MNPKEALNILYVRPLLQSLEYSQARSIRDGSTEVYSILDLPAIAQKGNVRTFQHDERLFIQDRATSGKRQAVFRDECQLDRSAVQLVERKPLIRIARVAI